MDAYGNASIKVLALASKLLDVEISSLQFSNFERVFRIMAFLDHYIDYKEITKKEAKIFLESNNFSEISQKFLPVRDIFIKLKESISVESFDKFVIAATKAIDFSNDNSTLSRHKEAVLVGLAVVNALDLQNPKVKLKLSNFFTKGSSFGNFSDDVVDFKKDSRSVRETIQRSAVALIQFRKLARDNGNLAYFLSKLFAIFIRPKFVQKK